MPAENTDAFMTTHQSKQSNEAVSPSKKTIAAEVLPGDGASRPGRNLDGTGAPPTNRAPDNCNNTYFQALRWGVDSLYLSYPGQLSETIFEELRVLKTLAQGRDDLAAKAQYRLGEHCFEVKDKGSGLFPFTLEDDAFQIRLASHKAKSLPMAYVKVSSRYLCHKSPLEVEAHLRALLEPLGELDAPKVSRIDLFVDFASSADMESLGRQAWVTKASSLSQYVQDQVFTGWLIGAGGVMMARLYNKQIEIKQSNKTYLEPLWREAGWDSELPVWRLEFQFKREIIDQLGLSSLPSVMSSISGLWSYACTEWLKLTIPSETDKTRSRWPIHPLWVLLASVDWETEGGALLREYSPIRAPSKKWLGQRALGAMSSIGALEGVSDFNAALNLLGNAAFQVLADKAMEIGIPEFQHFEEKVAVLNRKYNTAMNLKEPEETGESVLAREYRRMTQGY